MKAILYTSKKEKNATMKFTISVLFLLVSVLCMHAQLSVLFTDDFNRGTDGQFPGPGGTPEMNWS